MSSQDPIVPLQPQEWLTPASLPYQPYGQYGQPEPPTTAMYELRPLNLGEVLDRTFSLYRSHFLLFAGISAFSGALQAITAAGQMLTQSRLMSIAARGPGAPVGASEAMGMLVGPLVTLVASLLYFLVVSITTGATVFAVGETYLGRTVNVKDAFRATIGRWYRYIAIGLWQAWSFAWLPLLLLIPAFAMLAMRISGLEWLGPLLLVAGIFGGGIGGYILALRNTLAVPACVTERLAIRASMRRSKVLSPGVKFRVFVLSLIMGVLYFVVGMLAAPVQFIVMWRMMQHQSPLYVLQGIMLIINFVGHTVVGPVMAIGLTLLYFDQRVRKEAFDIAVLLGEEQMLEAGAPTSPATAEQVAAMAPLSPDAGWHGGGPVYSTPPVYGAPSVYGVPPAPQYLQGEAYAAAPEAPLAATQTPHDGSGVEEQHGTQVDDAPLP